MSRLNLGDSLILDTDYSTSEVKTGATWIDGKPIYSKVIQTTFPNSASQTGVSMGISNLGTVISSRGYSSDGSNNFNIPFAGATNVSNCWTSGGNLMLYTSYSGLFGKQVTVVVYYTKTTD